VPRRQENWLPVGDDLTLDEINGLLDARAKETPDEDSTFVAQARDGVLYVDPALASDRREFCADWATRMGWTVASVEQDTKLWGEMVGARRAERYPTIRWNFPWQSYVLIGVPDGLTRTMVYDFRVARNADVARQFVKPVAMAQADLFGLCFQRAVKRVQICVLKTEKVTTIEAPVDPVRGMETLRIFQSVDSGKPAGPPASWKCAATRCEYAQSCIVRKPQ
jgi:hypothetical protein